MTHTHEPTYFFELDDAPQLSAFDILDYVLVVTENALLAAHPELVCGEELQTDDLHEGVAEEICRQMCLLRHSIRRYNRLMVDHS
jgi:hypothetical protein